VAGSAVPERLSPRSRDYARDQFFDEAQWERDQKLGALIGEQRSGPTTAEAGKRWEALVELARAHCGRLDPDELTAVT